MCSHRPESNYHITLQQWQNHGSSMKNTYYLLFEDPVLNQKQAWFDSWIHNIKIVGNNLLDRPKFTIHKNLLN